MHRAKWLPTGTLMLATLIAGISGCTSPGDYLRNGFKVGPDTTIPAGPTAPQWINAGDKRLRDECPDVAEWWTIFGDPMLDRLVATASSQNLSLKEAGFRVLEARAQLGIASGNLFPQQQSAFGGYQRQAASLLSGDSDAFQKQFFDQWAMGFNLSWEIDFWGRFRRAVLAAEDTLGASCANYQQVLVTLKADVAANYILIRTLQKRIEYVRANIELQNDILGIADKRLQAGKKGASDVHQAQSTLSQTAAQVPQLQIAMRQAYDRLCVLLGRPPGDMEQDLGYGPIPTAPTSIAVGIPCQLLCRRPDVRRAQLQAEAQGEQIGIAEADLYPAFAINGTLGWQSENLSQLFRSKALNGSVGPVFQWNILNYGRIRNNMLAQDAEFKALIMHYQETVLRANAEVEDGLAAFLGAQERAQLLDTSVTNSQQAVELVGKEYKGGASDFNRVALLQQNLVQQQDLQAQSYGEIAQGLVQVYRALGGGWQTPSAAPAMAVVEPPREAVPPRDAMPQAPNNGAGAPKPPQVADPVAAAPAPPRVADPVAAAPVPAPAATASAAPVAPPARLPRAMPVPQAPAVARAPQRAVPASQPTPAPPAQSPDEAPDPDTILR